MMTDNNEKLPESNHEASKLMIDKKILIEALEKLVQDYPSSDIPLRVIRQTLIDVVGSADFSDLSGHPSLQRLDQLLLKIQTGASHERQS